MSDVSPSFRRRPTRWVLPCLVSLLLALLGAELVLRILFVVPRPIASNYPLGPGVAGSELRLQQREYDVRLRFNSFGFRDGEFPLVRRPGEKRILVLGDSFAEGIGVAEEDRFADLLETDLARREDGEVVVLTAGQMATGPASYLQNLLDFGLALEPDVVIMTIYVGNDFSTPGKMPAPSAPVREALPADPLRARGSWRSFARLEYVRAGLEQLLAGEKLLYRRPRRASPWEAGYGKPISRQFFLDALSAFKVRDDELDAAIASMDPELVGDFLSGRLNPSFFIAALAENIAALRGTPQHGPKDGRRRRDARTAASVARVVAVVARAHALLTSRGIALLVVVVPDVHEIQRAEHQRFLARIEMRPSEAMQGTAGVRRAFVHELRAQGVATLDLSSALRAAGEPTFHVMDGHFNEVGHRVAARAIADALAALERTRAGPGRD